MSPRPPDFAVELEQVSPPLPWPHAWRRKVRIGPAPQGDVTLAVDAEAPRGRVWTLSFALYDAHLDWLFGALEHHQLLATEWRDRPDVNVGGGAERLSVLAHGVRVVVPAFVTEAQAAQASAARTAVEALVPAALLDALEAKRDAYVHTYVQASRAT